MTATNRDHGVNSDDNHVPCGGGLTDPVLRALWVYGHVAWRDTPTVRPDWLGAVYQGQ